MKHMLVVGIEHLMTGLILSSENAAHGHGFQFVRESPSMMRVESDEPFMASWPNRSILSSAPVNEPFKGYYAGDGEIEWYGQVMAPAMVKEWERLYKAQTYKRIGGKLDIGEPECFPVEVIAAMVRKHGKEAFQWLCELRWNHDHWFYNKDRMYIGVEPDGCIHT